MQQAETDGKTRDQKETGKPKKPHMIPARKGHSGVWGADRGPVEGELEWSTGRAGNHVWVTRQHLWVEGASFPKGCGGASGQPWMLRVGTLAVWMEGSWGWGYPVYGGGHHPDTLVLLRFVRVCGADKSGRCCCGNNVYCGV